MTRLPICPHVGIAAQREIHMFTVRVVFPLAVGNGFLVVPGKVVVGDVVYASASRAACCEECCSEYCCTCEGKEVPQLRLHGCFPKLGSIGLSRILRRLCLPVTQSSVGLNATSTHPGPRPNADIYGKKQVCSFLKYCSSVDRGLQILPPTTRFRQSYRLTTREDSSAQRRFVGVPAADKNPGIPERSSAPHFTPVTAGLYKNPCISGHICFCRYSSC
jgi:hypothetical protein